jgi:hypothetical protein
MNMNALKLHRTPYVPSEGNEDKFVSSDRKDVDFQGAIDIVSKAIGAMGVSMVIRNFADYVARYYVGTCDLNNYRCSPSYCSESTKAVLGIDPSRWSTPCLDYQQPCDLPEIRNLCDKAWDSAFFWGGLSLAALTISVANAYFNSPSADSMPLDPSSNETICPNAVFDAAQQKKEEGKGINVTEVAAKVVSAASSAVGVVGMTAMGGVIVSTVQISARKLWDSIFEPKALDRYMYSTEYHISNASTAIVALSLLTITAVVLSKGASLLAGRAKHISTDQESLLKEKISTDEMSTSTAMPGECSLETKTIQPENQ